MSRSFRSRAGLVLGVTGLIVQPGAAQLSVGGGVRLAQPYVWRGVTRANGPSLQLEGSAGLGLSVGTLSAGVWANAELGEPRASRLSELGASRPGFSEVNGWGRYALNFGATTPFAGVIHYDYRGDSAQPSFGPDASTTELFAGVQLNRGRLVPQVTAYLDVHRVKGLYLEGALTAHIHQFSRALPVVLYANTVLGFSVLEGPDQDDPDEIARFQKESFTHLDLSLSLNIVFSRQHAVTFDIEPHLELKFDEATRRVGPGLDDQSRRQQFWMSMAFSFHPVLIRGHRGR